MSKKKFEPLNEFSGRLFFFFLKQEVVLGYGQKHPERPQFSLKLYHPLFYMNPNGPS